jgi:hypothetical protein
LGYKSSLINDCVFYKDDIIFMVYVDDGIFLGPDNDKLIQAIRDNHNAGLTIEDQGHPADYVGVNIRKAKDRSYKSLNAPLLTPLLMTLDWMTRGSSQFLPRLLSYSMLIKMNLLSISP